MITYIKYTKDLPKKVTRALSKFSKDPGYKVIRKKPLKFYVLGKKL